MIDGDKAIEYLKNKLINLIDQGIINATYEESKRTISFYITDITATNRPPLTLRLSNHHENFNNRKRNDLPQGDGNLSIELYKPQKGYKNRAKNNVNLYYFAPPKPEVIPFSVTTIEYRPWLMCGNDVNLIYQSILNWIKSKNKNTVYIDPLAKTSRRANIQTHQANITPRRYVTQAEKNFYLRYGLGDSVEPRYNIIKENKNCNRTMNKKLIRLTESDLHRIVKESVNNVLNEIGDTPYGQYMLGRAANRALNYPDGDNTFSDLKKKAKESAFNSGLSKYADGRHTSYFFDGDEDQENFDKQVDMMYKGRGNDEMLNQAKDTIRNNASRYYNDSGLGKKSSTPTVSSNDDAAKMRQQRMDIRNRYRM